MLAAALPRHDWTLPQVEAPFDRTFMALVFRNAKRLPPSPPGQDNDNPPFQDLDLRPMGGAVRVAVFEALDVTGVAGRRP